MLVGELYAQSRWIRILPRASAFRRLGPGAVGVGGVKKNMAKEPVIRPFRPFKAAGVSRRVTGRTFGHSTVKIVVLVDVVCVFKILP